MGRKETCTRQWGSTPAITRVVTSTGCCPNKVRYAVMRLVWTFPARMSFSSLATGAVATSSGSTATRGGGSTTLSAGSASSSLTVRTSWRWSPVMIITTARGGSFKISTALLVSRSSVLGIVLVLLMLVGGSSTVLE